jgi:DNA-binding IclR family transcriptional regulator
MTRVSPAVLRTVAVLDFFADHPGQAFTLTDIVRGVRLSRATCHALLAALVEANYLYRASDKSYVLGPAVARLGAAAQQNISPLQVAQSEMRALADEMDVVCSVTLREKDEAVVRERAASVSHLGWSVPLGTRIPLKPPFGGVFVAWSKPSEIERWVARMQPPPDAKLHDRLLKSLEFMRQRGFSYGVRTEGFQSDENARSLNYNPETTDYLVGDFDPMAEYQLGFVAAPVFDGAGAVVFTIGLMGFRGRFKGREVERIARRLIEACRRVSAFMGGAQPGL